MTPYELAAIRAFVDDTIPCATLYDAANSVVKMRDEMIKPLLTEVESLRAAIRDTADPPQEYAELNVGDVVAIRPPGMRLPDDQHTNIYVVELKVLDDDDPKGYIYFLEGRDMIPFSGLELRKVTP